MQATELASCQSQHGKRHHTLQYTTVLYSTVHRPMGSLKGNVRDPSGGWEVLRQGQASPRESPWETARASS